MTVRGGLTKAGWRKALCRFRPLCYGVRGQRGRKNVKDAQAVLCSAMEEKIACCKAAYERHKDDAFLSTLYAHKLQSFEGYRRRLQAGEAAQALLMELQQALPALKQDREREAESPTFDWYDDHYHYKVLSGQYEAMAEMIELLQAQAAGQAEPARSPAQG